LTPLLAFDDARYRLGQGGGFYDRTLEKLKNREGGVLSIGVAFSAQRIEAVPRDRYDQQLDMIVTEKGRM
ncbi:MAG TPA: 5-formyltetrahydrofolate cyclo-ligase, partial [Rhodospirillales bacterium]|nr:5-formyltetrahydrofolate cyclo-ligase [Rhodospirillales bacterium]